MCLTGRWQWSIGPTWEVLENTPNENTTEHFDWQKPTLNPCRTAACMPKVTFWIGKRKIWVSKKSCQFANLAPNLPCLTGAFQKARAAPRLQDQDTFLLACASTGRRCETIGTKSYLSGKKSFRIGLLFTRRRSVLKVYFKIPGPSFTKWHKRNFKAPFLKRERHFLGHFRPKFESLLPTKLRAIDRRCHVMSTN